MSLFRYLVGQTDFQALARFVSPRFFSVVSLGETLSVVAKVVGSARDEEGIERSRVQLDSILAPHQIVLVERPFQRGNSNELPVTVELGERILQAYFLQILHSSVWILDFRKESWQVSQSKVHWAPSHYSYTPSDSFLQAVRSLYRGFYRGEDAEFDQALETLGLSAARSSLLEYFGPGDQSQVRFSLKSFQRIFSQVFDSCRENGSRIHPEFAVLGAMLISLYECLESVESGLNVRLSFERAEK